MKIECTNNIHFFSLPPKVGNPCSCGKIFYNISSLTNYRDKLSDDHAQAKRRTFTLIKGGKA